MLFILEVIITTITIIFVINTSIIIIIISIIKTIAVITSIILNELFAPVNVLLGSIMSYLS